MRLFLIALFLLLTTATSFAKWVDGYITLTDGTNVNGRINVPYVNMESRAILLLGTDLSHFYYSVRFANKELGKKCYYPGDIKGFGFTIKAADFHFVSLDVQYRSIVKNEREREQFLHVLYSNEVVLMTRLVPFYYEIPGMEGWGGVNHVNSYDYYLYNSEMGLTRLQVNKEFKSLKNILQLYGVSEVFLEQLPENIKRFDVYNILLEYDMWKTSRGQSTILNT
ncbi:hypothetical protein J1N10_02200 [Carboxylicivirga sp. A043]|uniref:hypothetical protein n=1 Tax=Carboxylicivirga litoralis TaxID=2816963 RepID=UPI0021CB5B35|nr:hypothetical protein [Carboxylicivirga sp. A043]MCU4154768.1 hypothetical protein [Carboxylicivirga sp. A043]